MNRVQHPLRLFRTGTVPAVSVHEVGRLLGVSGATISRIENGLQDPSPQLAKRISSYAKIPLWQLRPDLWTPDMVPQGAAQPPAKGAV